MNVESRESIHALQLTKAIERHFACGSDELEQLGTFCLVERANGTPKPLNWWRGGLVVVVFSVVLPIVDVDVGQARNEEFKLLLVKNGNELRGNDVVEAWPD